MTLENSGFGCSINGVYAGIYGYSDDDLLLSPTLTGLQTMIRITEDYSQSHGLRFSTDPDPRKSKTKCISWMRVPRPLPRMILCGHQLPWVERILHLGNTLTNSVHIINEDMIIKNACYVVRNIEINQEFNFSAAETRLQVNQIYNLSWFGSVLWDSFCPAAVRLESSYNHSIKIMMNLPLATHRELIEPLSDQKHVKLVFIKSFIQIITKMWLSKKPILRTLIAAVTRVWHPSILPLSRDEKDCQYTSLSLLGVFSPDRKGHFYH